MKIQAVILGSVFGTAILCVAVPIGLAVENAVAKPVQGALKDAAGKVVGTVSLTDSEEGAKLQVTAKGLTPGQHGIHLHEEPICEASAKGKSPKFESAGAHFNPTQRSHGLENGNGSHLGDMPNLEAKEDGTAEFEHVFEGLKVSGGKDALLAKGVAVVIHEKADDQKTDPSGDSGARVACAAIKKR